MRKDRLIKGSILALGLAAMPATAGLHAAEAESAVQITPPNSTQNTDIKGVVLDVNGDPLPGASVRVKNTPKNATSTDIDGKF